MSLIGVILPYLPPGYNQKTIAVLYKLSWGTGEKEVQFVYMSQLSVFLQRTITTLLCLTGAFVFFRWLLGPLLPFLLALALSAMAEPLVQRVRRWMGVRRSFAAALVTTLLLVVLGGAVALLLVRLGMELRQWSARLPEVIEGFPALWNGLLDRVGAWYAASPPFLRSALDALAEQLMEEGPSLAGEVGSLLMGAASSLLAALPDVGLFLVTTVLAVYFTRTEGRSRFQVPAFCRCRIVFWVFVRPALAVRNSRRWSRPDWPRNRSPHLRRYNCSDNYSHT